jgi:hypothetical protein
MQVTVVKIQQIVFGIQLLETHKNREPTVKKTAPTRLLPKEHHVSKRYVLHNDSTKYRA